MRRLTRALPAALLLVLPLSTACAPQDEPGADGPVTSSGASGAAPACAPADLDTVEPDTLTVATDQPAYEPWMVDDDPTNGEGFESAVAYAVAGQLGYDEDAVTWVRVPFDTAINPSVKNFDFDINQFTITDERRQAVDFSSPYYTATQAVITYAGSPADGATTLADLKGLRIAAQVSTTSLQVLTDVIDPDAGPVVFNTNDDAKLALQNQQVDAMVVDLPTAFFITAAELDDGVIVGQVDPEAAGASGADQFGLLLGKDSPLTTCVSAAVDALTEDGTLADLEDQWLTQTADAPVLR